MGNLLFNIGHTLWIPNYKLKRNLNKFLIPILDGESRVSDVFSKSMGMTEIMLRECMIIMLLKGKKLFFQLVLRHSLLINLDQCRMKLLSLILSLENFGWKFQFKVPYLLECSIVEHKCKLEFSQRCHGKTTKIVKAVFIRTTISITWTILVNSDFSKMVKPNVTLQVKSIIIWMFIPINHLLRQISSTELLMVNKSTLSLLLNSRLREPEKTKTISFGLMVKLTVLKI